MNYIATEAIIGAFKKGIQLALNKIKFKKTRYYYYVYFGEGDFKGSNTCTCVSESFNPFFKPYFKIGQARQEMSKRYGSVIITYFKEISYEQNKEYLGQIGGNHE